MKYNKNLFNDDSKYYQDNLKVLSLILAPSIKICVTFNKFTSSTYEIKTAKSVAPITKSEYHKLKNIKSIKDLFKELKKYTINFKAEEQKVMFETLVENKDDKPIKKVKI